MPVCFASLLFNDAYEFIPLLKFRTCMFSLNALWLAAFFNTNPIFMMGISFYFGFRLSDLCPLYQKRNNNNNNNNN